MDNSVYFKTMKRLVGRVKRLEEQISWNDDAPDPMLIFVEDGDGFVRRNDGAHVSEAQMRAEIAALPSRAMIPAILRKPKSRVEAEA